tara:strand:+ start:20855 stop:22882 length:2028 start_codon:yes stop_codon:yes gene_type:complete
LETSVVIFIVIALFVSIGIAYYQYYYKTKGGHKALIILFLLRTTAFFLLFLLLINPKINKTSYVNEKPKLSMLFDNSESIKYFQQDSLVEKTLGNFKDSKQLNNQFDINYYSFGDEFQLNDSLTFNEPQSNMSEALRMISNLNKDDNSAIVLISDGNQTLGNDYEYELTRRTIYPLIVGDTIKHEDLSITQLNVNRYSFINNQFPIEALLLYDGINSVRARFTIENRGKVVYSKQINFNADKIAHTVSTNLKSDKEGVNFYKAKIEYLNDEKNTNNNIKNFSVEVIDKQSQVLILSAIYHPDLGALKKSIESDQQRKVEIKLIEDTDYQLSNFQLVILYQPNFQFKKVIDQINNEKVNYFLITGSKTDWSFLSTKNLGIQKNSINQVENYATSFNAGFLTFSQKDIGFDNFPPLIDKFGQTSISLPHQKLLFQSINGFSTREPLLATVDENNHRKVFLFGEGIWRWRTTSFLNRNSFENFDEFIGNLIQFASSKKIRNRLDVDIKSIYNSNSIIKIGAFYVDSNFEFDDRATLIFNSKNKTTNENKSFPFSLENNSYQLELDVLEPGDYDYTVSVVGQSISRSGVFKVSEYSVEEQFTNANKEKLTRLAEKTNGKAFYIDKSQALINELLNDKRFVTTQKEVVKKQEIIDFKWIMFFVIGLLTIEWLTRKYIGKI